MIDHHLLIYAGTLAIFIAGVLVVAVAALGALTAVAVAVTVSMVRAHRNHTTRGMTVPGSPRAATWPGPRQEPATGRTFH